MPTIKRSDFVANELPRLYMNKYRVRLLETSTVPIIGEMALFKEKELIVIDLPPNAKQQSKQESENEASAYGNSSTITDSSDQAGSPLKFSFITLEKLRQNDTRYDTVNFGEFDLNETAFDCNPLRSVDGRRLVNSLTVDEWPLDAESFGNVTVWIVLNASDAMKTAFLGVNRSHNLIITHNVRCFAKGDPTLENYIQPKFRFLDQFQVSNSAYCSYDLIPAEGNANTDAVTRITANVQLLANWRSKSDDDSLLVQPPYSASVSLSVSAGWLDKRMPYSEWSQELCILLALGNALRTGTMKWQPIDASVTTEKLKHSLKALLEEEELGGAVPTCGDSSEYRDLSERLWILLRNCSSNSMLVNALQVVWNALKCGYKNTMMHSNNKSTIARLMKDACAGDLKLPRLEGLTPLEILLEAGLEYFQRSCIHQLIANGFVVSANELETLYRISANLSSEDRVDRVFILFQALVVMCCCKQYLNLHHQQRNLLARRVFMHYGKLKISPTSDGMVTEDTARKLHLNLNMNVNLNDVYPSVFKIKTPSTWRKESVYSDGKEPSYMVMSHFARTTKLAHIASKVSHFQSFEVSSARSDETLQTENEVGDESNETWKDNNTRVGNKLDEKRSQFDGYYGSLLISSFTKMPLV